MDPRFLEYYERELKHVREMGGEFAREFPAIAKRLSLNAFECTDPYVERLLEGFAFLTARVQLKLDAAFPQFTQHMLELLYPGYLAPTPSMAVVQMLPNPREGALVNGVEVPRGTSLRSNLGQNQTACEYRTAHTVELFPIEIVSADYRALPSEQRDGATAQLPAAKAMLKLVLRCTGGRTFDQLRLERLPLFLRGRDTAPRLYEHLLSASTGMVMRSEGASESVLHVSHRSPIAAQGFAEDQALLPCGVQAFHGHRLLHEYFAFPERFLFVSLEGLSEGARRCRSSQLEIQVLLDRTERRLEGMIKESQLALFCTPVVNLFPRKSDRIPLTDADHEYHVVPDRTRPADFEVYSVARAVGHGAGQGEQVFTPLYAGGIDGKADSVHFAVRRQPKVLPAQDAHASARSLYVPAETFLSLVDGERGPFGRGLSSLAVDTLFLYEPGPAIQHGHWYG